MRKLLALLILFTGVTLNAQSKAIRALPAEQQIVVKNFLSYTLKGGTEIVFFYINRCRLCRSSMREFKKAEKKTKGLARFHFINLSDNRLLKKAFRIKRSSLPIIYLAINRYPIRHIHPLITHQQLIRNLTLLLKIPSAGAKGDRRREANRTDR